MSYVRSHAFISLDKHIESLLTYARNFKSYGVDYDRQITEVISWHDEGKKNKYFQERIVGVENGIDMKRDQEHDKHAVLSTMSYMVRGEYENSKAYLENLNMILGHHGKLKSFDLLTDVLYGYIEDKALNESLGTFDEISEDELRSSYFGVDDAWYDVQESWGIEDSVRIRRKFSMIVDADRLSAMRRSEFNREDLIERGFHKEASMYHKALGFRPKNRLDGVRKEIKFDFDQVMSRSWGTFTLTLPTGMGKTIAAARLSEKLKEKIVYVVPYLTVSDQTYDVFSDIYRNREHRDMWDFLVKHDSRLDEQDYGVDEYDQTINVRDMITSWRSKIVVTTSVQFFDSLVSLSASRLRKLHNTYGSTILIDEPQGIPYEKWEFLKKVVYYYARELKWRVIYLSATPPSMLDSTIQLVKNESYTFEQLARTRIKYVGRRSGYQGPRNWVMDAVEYTKGKNQILWLLNVERLARKVYELAGDYVAGRKIVFVSGKLPPLVRAYKLRKIKEMMENGEKLLVISTQVLEAGVDLDFDGVVRDLAPMPVLIQVAGRLNRKWSRDTETLYVMQLMENSVYSDFEFRHTGAVLYDRFNEIEEKDYFNACKEYYALCEEMPPSETPSSWMDEFTHLRECGMKVIDELDYQTSGYCLSIDDWLGRLRRFDQSQYDEFMNFVTDYSGMEYMSVFEALRKVHQLRYELAVSDFEESDQFDKVRELVSYERYVDMFETSCRLSELKSFEVGSKKYDGMEIPIELLGV